MPEVTAATFNLDDKSPVELENRRREIVSDLSTRYKGYDDPDVPPSLLHELVAITSQLRRKNAGPPKPAKRAAAPKVKATLDDLMA